MRFARCRKSPIRGPTVCPFRREDTVDYPCFARKQADLGRLYDCASMFTATLSGPPVDPLVSVYDFTEFPTGNLSCVCLLSCSAVVSPTPIVHFGWNPNHFFLSFLPFSLSAYPSPTREFSSVASSRPQVHLISEEDLCVRLSSPFCSRSHSCS
jgi:hypothetical protein